MKVLEVISSLAPTGGGETFAVNLSRELTSRIKLKVVILYNKNRPFFIDRLRESGIEPTILDKHHHLDFKNAKQLRNIIKDFKPDVIHTENNALIPTFLALRKTKFKKSTFVYHTMHLVPEKECANSMVRFLYKRIFRRKNYIPVAITEQLSLISKDFYKKNNVPFIYNGTDLLCFNNKIELTKRNYDVVVVGRFSEEKNHKFLVKALLGAYERLPSLNVAFVGGGDLLEDTKKYANELGATFIDFRGVMSNPWKIVNDSKIIALGSHYEANPLSLIEGMASGCIVVAPNVGGIPDVIKNGKNGFLFETNNEQEFIERIIEILSDIDYWKEKSNYNQKYSQEFSISKCADNYISLFKRELDLHS